MGLKLWVDDERPEPYGWVRVSNVQNALAILAAGVVDELSLDHDLDSHVDTRNGDSEELTGYDIACWLENQAAHTCWHLVPGSIHCHSDNPVGRRKIEQAIAWIDRARANRRM